jgi:Na+-driven multidrug efflux pump
MYHQVAGPLYRAYNTTSTIIVGQSLGEGDPEQARFDGYAHAAFSLLTLLVAGVALYLVSPHLVRLLTDDAATITYAVNFARTFAVAMPFIAIFFSFSGALQGASETRVPFVARATGLFVFFMGFSYLVGTVLGYGVVGAYGGIVLMYVWWALLVSASFLRGGWARRATDMMAARAEAESGSSS